MRVHVLQSVMYSVCTAPYLVAYKTLYVSYLGNKALTNDESIVSHDCIFHNLFFLSVLILKYTRF